MCVIRNGQTNVGLHVVLEILLVRERMDNIQHWVSKPNFPCQKSIFIICRDAHGGAPESGYVLDVSISSNMSFVLAPPKLNPYYFSNFLE